MQERLHFPDQLKHQLSRDFLGLLPPEIAVKILGYLAADDLANGLKVCHKWRKLITEAPTSMWRAATRDMGLSEFVIDNKLAKHGSMSALTLAALKHRKCIASASAKVLPMSAVAGSRLRPHFDYHWAGHGIVVGLEDSTRGVSSPFDVDIIFLQDALTYRAIRCMSGIADTERPLWSTAIGRKYLMWRSISGRQWLQCGLDGTEMDSDLPWQLQSWKDARAFEEGVANVCEKCGLVALLPVQTNELGATSWKLTTLKHVPAQVKPLKTVCRLKMPTAGYRTLTGEEWREAKIEDLDSFSGSGISVPEGRRGTCESHCLLVRVSGSIIVYHIPASASGTYKLLRVMQAQGENDSDKLAFFQRSADGKLVSLLSGWSCRHHIWELDGGRYHAVPIPSNCVCCLALGHLYSIIHQRHAYSNEHIIKVVVTYTGEVIFNCACVFPGSVLYTSGLPYPRFWETLDSMWLNDFDHYQSGVWHVMAVNSGCAEHKLFSVVGLSERLKCTCDA